MICKEIKHFIVSSLIFKTIDFIPNLLIVAPITLRNSTIIQDYEQIGCTLISPIQFQSMDILSHNVSNILIWLQNSYRETQKCITHWKKISQTNRNTINCFVTTSHLAKMRIEENSVTTLTIAKGVEAYNIKSGVGSKLPSQLLVKQISNDFLNIHIQSIGSGKTILISTRLNNIATIVLIDTGATDSFINKAFVEKHNIAHTELQTREQSKAIIPNGNKIELLGTTKLSLTFPNFTCKHTFIIAQLAMNFDAILGMDWLHLHKAQINCNTKSCSLFKGKQRIILQNVGQEKRNTNTLLINAIQVQKALSKGNLVFIFSIDTTEDVPTIEDTYEDDLSWGQRTEMKDIPPQMKQLLASFEDIFPSDLPTGLPPERDVGHTIPLLPDTKPSYRPLYRLSPKELTEAKTQINDLLSKKWIEPSRSPFGAPILFVQKKDGSLRMCVDYRALNKNTIKNRYALPRIDDLIDKLQGAQYFTSLDLAQGYHQIRITPEDVPKTAFRTPLGLFQYRVLPFGLTNAPATFQYVMNQIFAPYLDQFVLVYLDDILIFSKTEEEHLQHVQRVFHILREQKLYAKLKKCQFMTDSLLYLGHIITKNGVKPDNTKISALVNWPQPKDVTQIRSFLGFANYFRKFVQGYGNLIAPLTNLTRKNTDFVWDKHCEEAFQGVIHHLTHAPTLCLPDPNKPYEVICDASGIGLGAVLLQNGRPIAFDSHIMNKAEQNYAATEQELLAVVRALQVWRCYLEGCVGLTIVTDHKPNIYIDTSKLTRRQVRWAEFLSKFSYELTYRPGRGNVADPLSRNFSKPRVLACPMVRTTQGSPVETSEALQTSDVSFPTQGHDHVEYLTTHKSMAPLSRHALKEDIIAWIRSEYSHDPLFQGDLGLGQLEQSHRTTSVDLQNGLYIQNGKIMVPDNQELKLEIIRHHHDLPYSGHFGVAKTYASIGRDFFWQNLRTDVKAYVSACDTCQRDKSSNLRPAGKLLPLEIPARRWSSVSMDFITELPLTKDGHDCIFVIVDRLTKMVHFIPTVTTLSAEDVAKLYLENVFKHHGFPESIVSDRDARFTGNFWKELCRLVGIKQHMSTAFHPQTDGQTERVNRIVEEFLRHYVNPRQDNWDELLPLAEFAINNSKHASTNETPFYLNSGQHPLNPLTLTGKSGNRRSTLRGRSGSSRLPAVEAFVRNISESLHQAKVHLRKAQDRQKSYADQKRREVVYEKEDQILLQTKNLKIKSSGSKKLLPKYIGPFKILDRIGTMAYKIELPAHMKCHNVFHVSNLQPYRTDGRVQPPPIPLVIDDDLQYEVDQVIDHRDIKRGNRSKREYLLKWLGYGPEHNSWEPATNLLCDELIKQYWTSRADAQRARQRQ